MEKVQKSYSSFLVIIAVVSAAAAGISYLLPRLVVKGAAPAGVLGPSMVVLTGLLIWTIIIKPARASVEMHFDRTRITLENVVDAVIHFDARGRIESFNASAVKMFGYDPEEVIGRPLSDLIPHDIWNLGKSAEITACHRNGSSFTAEIFVSRMQAGKRTSFVSIVHDVSRRKEAERALLESEQRYHSLFRNMLNGFVYLKVVFDQHRAPHDFLYLDVNEAFHRLTGLRNVIGRKVSEILPSLQPSFPRLFEMYARVATTGKQETFEMQLEDIGIWLLVSAFSPEPEHLVAIFENITLRKKAEKEILDAKAEWERTFDAIVDPLMILDTNHRIVKANKAATVELGEPQCHLVGAKCCMTRHDSEKPLHRCPHTMLLGDGNPHAGEVYDPRKGKYFDVTVSPLYGPDGKLQGSVHLSRDITEQKNLEKQLQQSQKMEAVGTLAGGVAHDFNNVLTAIIGYGTLVQMRMAQDDPALNQVNALLLAADRAADLTRSLLTFSRQDKLELKPIDLNQVVSGVEKMLRRLIRDDIEMRIELAGAALDVMGDKGQIEQVLMNLSINAQDAMEETGILTISTAEIEEDGESKQHEILKPGKYAVLTCSDTGKGMDEETQQRIFEPFFTTKEVGKGTGLGLSIVYGIVKHHKGFITCNSEPGRGTAFRVYLPVTEARAAKGEVPEKALPLPTGTETVLIAEDDEPARALLKDVLEKFGYRVITACNGEEAVSEFRAHAGEVKIVILDSIMPKMNGREALGQMRLLDDGVKAVFMTGYPGVKSDFAGRGVAFLRKPINTRSFLIEIRNLLDEKEATSSGS